MRLSVKLCGYVEERSMCRTDAICKNRPSRTTKMNRALMKESYKMYIQKKSNGPH